MDRILTHIHHIPIRRNFVENMPYNPHLKVLLKERRKAGVLSEVLFWKQVRARSFHNIDFDRQRIIGNYIVDFYVKALGLVVEIEGTASEDNSPGEKINCQYLESLNLKVFSVSDFDIKNNVHLVLQELENFIILNFGDHPVKN
ncbi:MAG: DUF559 domain-containing protein [Kaistella sp.]